LASASSGRQRVLRQAGIDPVVIVSGVDEDALTARLPADASPGEVTIALATAKADAVARSLSAELAADAVVIGCDSMLYLNGTLRGKPGTAQRAHAAWQEMAGSSGELFTGHCVVRVRDGDVIDAGSEFCCTTVRFATPDADDLDAYVASGEPLVVAGSFTLDGLGGWFIDGVDGDPSSVIGISLPLTRRLLERVGLSISVLWQANPVD
jgi:septum formation protein